MMKDRQAHTPPQGFDLVGIDNFELLGEQLYTIKHFETYEAAKNALEDWKQKQTDDAIILPNLG